jgi:dTDP-4-amino-4,6-dideoxygalactose transaminase
VARTNAAWYDAEIFHRDISRVQLTERVSWRRSSYWLYPVLVDDPARFITFMKTKGVHTSQVHIRNDVHSCFAESRATLPGVDAWTAHQCSIPVGWWVGQSDRESVMDAIEAYDRA